MKKLLKGFTLAEVLLTLTIIGVVARLTLPALLQNVQAHSVATSLSKAVNTLEMGNQRILQETGSQSLSGADIHPVNSAEDQSELNTNEYLRIMNLYMNGSYNSSTTLTINEVVKYNQPIFISKDGILFANASSISLTEPLDINRRGESLSPAEIRVVPQKYHGSYAKVLVDINGEKGPNRLAKDQFVFYVDNYGSAIAYGGMEYQGYARGSIEAQRNGQTGNPIWKASCGSGMIPANDDAKAACTGSIVDNNYSVIYTY